MSVNTQTDFFALVQHRHAVKHFDSNYKLSKQEIMELIAAAAKAPSAWNLQHWRFLAFTEQAAKEKLLPVAYGQKQVAEASVVVAVLGDLEANRNAESVYRGAIVERMDTGGAASDAPPAFCRIFKTLFALVRIVYFISSAASRSYR